MNQMKKRSPTMGDWPNVARLWTHVRMFITCWWEYTSHKVKWEREKKVGDSRNVCGLLLCWRMEPTHRPQGHNSAHGWSHEGDRPGYPAWKTWTSPVEKRQKQSLKASSSSTWKRPKAAHSYQALLVDVRSVWSWSKKIVARFQLFVHGNRKWFARQTKKILLTMAPISSWNQTEIWFWYRQWQGKKTSVS